ncbi:MAG: serine--tRNA ligase [Synechococcus sp. TMED187]|uniref:serine--tRNA ligase n=1 Tax=Synechococcus sp. UW105 TaxID=337067 RepID=UPI000B6335A9|nr:serine--tRNA ligase [Synechococcus sp. UW105]OUW45025.1 MAG: serine--tRNA ligase [Synechococcus sp. TMED187]RZO13207.1 MAG: serine--tRNA ligase [Synechococcus sp. MED-G135]
MLDQRLVRDNPDFIAQQLGRRGLDVDLTGLQLIANQQRDLEERRSSLQAEGNTVGKQVGLKIKGGADPKGSEVAELRHRGNTIKQQVAVLEEEEKQLSSKLREQLLSFPNLPSVDCPEGRSEADNKEVRRWGEPRKAEGLEEHWQIADRLGLLETERSVRIAQSRFVTLMGQGARLERALINFMLDLHCSKGYKEVLPPVLVNSASLQGSGQLPKFAEESFRCADDDLWLTPTAEVPVTSLHRDEIIPADLLPVRYVAYSPCFRREAGSYGRDTRGLIRLHQFNKVELYWFSHPDQSDQAHAQITADAEAVLQALDLPYRVLDLCTGDIGFSAARTYDLEVWLAGAGAYREISSCSVCGDFQARRSSIRTKEGKATRLVHTLNGSGLAIGRTMAAVLENGQQADGSVLLPEALAPYFGADRLQPE